MQAATEKWDRTEVSLSRATARHLWLALGGLTLLAAILRIVGLNSGLWYDEIRTLVDSVRPPLGQILTEYGSNNKHPLFSVLGHLAIQVFGDQPWSLRLPAFFFGVASVPMIYFLGITLTSRREAFLSAALLTVSYHHIWFSQNARGYSALAFWTLLCTYFLIIGLRNGRRGAFFGYSVAAALGIYTHLTMVFVVLSHVLICALLLGMPTVQRIRTGEWRLPGISFVLSGLFASVMYAPIFIQVHQFFIARPHPMEVATPGWAFWEALRGLQIGLGTWVGVLAAGVLFGCGLSSYLKQSRFISSLFILPGVLTGIVAVLMRRPIFPRFFFFLIGFGVLILIRGAYVLTGWIMRSYATTSNSREPGRALGTALVGVMILLSAASLAFNYRYPKQDFEGAMHFVNAQKEEGEPVVTAGLATYPYRNYYGQVWESVENLEQLQAIRTRGRRVWLLYTLPAYIELQTPDLMAAIQRDCPVVRILRGTVGGGDIVVCRTELEGRM